MILWCSDSNEEMFQGTSSKFQRIIMGFHGLCLKFKKQIITRNGSENGKEKYIDKSGLNNSHRRRPFLVEDLKCKLVGQGWNWSVVILCKQYYLWWNNGIGWWNKRSRTSHVACVQKNCLKSFYTTI